MPRSAIQTGAVDLIPRVADIPAALARHDRRLAPAPATPDAAASEPAPDWLPVIIELLRTRTVHDFSLYKPGTLQRRIERRMALAAVQTDGIASYLAMLRDCRAKSRRRSTRRRFRSTRSSSPRTRSC
jgi:two-component system CheB/CheR fusion protein